MLDHVFAALSDPTRRQVLEALGSGSQSVSTLAQSHGMSLPGFMKHLRVLESAGLIARLKEGRVVRCTLAAEPMQEAACGCPATRSSGASGWMRLAATCTTSRS